MKGFGFLFSQYISVCEYGGGACKKRRDSLLWNKRVREGTKSSRKGIPPLSSILISSPIDFFFLSYLVLCQKYKANFFYEGPDSNLATILGFVGHEGY